jgi:2-keto-4-pentenoate hydratase/2-oxohepta-3-ene-1,7-dioic acid hydratase in catechol pathway
LPQYLFMKIICIGRNYAEHAKELGNSIPDEPVIFMKPKSAMLNTFAPFYYPEFTNELHYECELVLRVSKNGKYIPKELASTYVNGMSVGIDFTARDIQNELKKNGLPWEKAKAFDNSAAVGKFVDFAAGTKLQNIQFSLNLNGQKVQDGNSNEMIFDFDSIISNISNYFSLNIGDLIFTGTPSGVGECNVGDKLEAFLGEEKMLSLAVK